MLDKDQAREWYVYSTVVDDHAILVECRLTGKRGSILNYTLEEWASAFHAPSNPYPWVDHGRVIEDESE